MPIKQRHSIQPKKETIMKTEEKKFALASKQIPTVNSGWLDRELGEAMIKIA